MRAKGFLKIIRELGYPPIFIISPHQFSMIEGEEKREANSINDRVVGLAAIDFPVITIHPWLEGKVLDNVIYHEIAHHLWPWRPHWWIEMFGQKMARGGGRGYYSKKYKKKLSDLPPRDRLVKMARKQSEKLKKAYRIARTDTYTPIPHPDYKKRP